MSLERARVMSDEEDNTLPAPSVIIDSCALFLIGGFSVANDGSRERKIGSTNAFHPAVPGKIRTLP